MSLPRYPKYKDSGVQWLGDVPEHWNVGKCGFYLRVLSGSAFPSSGFTEEESATKLLRGINVGVGRLKWVETVYWRRTDGDGLDPYEMSAGDLVIGMDRPLIGEGVRAAKVMTSDLPCLLLQRVASLKTGDKLITDYLLGFLSSGMFVAYFSPDTTGVSVPHISPEQIRNFVIAIPPTTEQDRIAAFLDRETAKIDALVAEQQRLIELLKEKRQAVISHAVTKGLNPDAPMKDSGIEWLGEVPAHWELRRLKHISPSITVGIVVNPSTFVADEGLPFIYGGDIREGVIDWENARRIAVESSQANAKILLVPGDLLTVRVGAPGVTAVVPAECAGGNCASVMLVRKGEYNSNWLCFAMNTRIVRFQVEVVQYGAAQEQFNISHAVNFWAPTPPYSEQNHIAEFLAEETSKLDSLTGEAQRAIDLLQERRTALISAAVTGQIDARAAAERASA